MKSSARISPAPSSAIIVGRRRCRYGRRKVVRWCRSPRCRSCRRPLSGRRCRPLRLRSDSCELQFFRSVPRERDRHAAGVARAKREVDGNMKPFLNVRWREARGDRGCGGAIGCCGREKEPKPVDEAAQACRQEGRRCGRPSHGFEAPERDGGRRLLVARGCKLPSIELGSSARGRSGSQRAPLGALPRLFNRSIAQPGYSDGKALTLSSSAISAASSARSVAARLSRS